MGDEEQGSTEDQQYSTATEEPSYSSSGHESGGYDPSAYGGDGSSGADPSAEGPPTALSEDLFNQLGALYAAGDYQSAIDRVKPLVDAGPGNPNWGRGAYGLVMCYDQLSQFPDAARYMRQIVTNLGNHPNADQYQQQLDCYTQGGGQHWTGDFLLY